MVRASNCWLVATIFLAIIALQTETVIAKHMKATAVKLQDNGRPNTPASETKYFASKKNPSEDTLVGLFAMAGAKTKLRYGVIHCNGIKEDHVASAVALSIIGGLQQTTVVSSQGPAKSLLRPN